MSNEPAPREIKGHADLPVLLRALDDESDLGTLRGKLTALEGFLVRHFDEETRDGGWFDLLRGDRPECDHELKRLAQEHEDILDSLTKLFHWIGECEEQLAKIFGEVEGFRLLLQTHCDREHRLALDALLVDEGGAD